jgi:ABC-type polysaccharide/polyol phosphate transport system ATPase subunit
LIFNLMLPGWARLCRFVRRSRFPGLGLVVLGRHRNAALALMRPFSTEIWYGERVAVLGLNGSGKSHYLRLLDGEDIPA